MQLACATAPTDPGLALGAELLSRFDVAGPRYTSYPTADRFVETFGAAQYRQALAGRAFDGQAGGDPAPLSVYVHIPFCESVCYYCACNKIVTRHHGRALAYLDALECEFAMQTALLGEAQDVTQLHLGGGTPTFLSDAELDRLMRMLRRGLRLMPSVECSIEVDPRTVTEERLAHLSNLGFDRLSFGVQDFDPGVQQAVHRVQPVEQVARLFEAAKALRFKSINVDLIHGLPKQTPESFARTVEQVAQLRPDRIALYAYAHLPQRFKPQRRIDTLALPSAEQRLGMLSSAISGFLRAGYCHVGMDHFALPEDALAIAKREGRMHRNFQGYSTQPDCDLIGLGVSAIGKVGATYSQNAKELPDYYDALRAGDLPIARGLALSRNDLMRRSIIMALMCQGRLDFEAIEAAHPIDFRLEFAPELARLAELAEQGLVKIGAGTVSVTPLGWYFIRAIVMVFDEHLQPSDRTRERYSRVI